MQSELLIAILASLFDGCAAARQFCGFRMKAFMSTLQHARRPTAPAAFIMCSEAKISRHVLFGARIAPRHDIRSSWIPAASSVLMSTAASSEIPTSTSIKGLSSEEKSIYQELSRLSERIRVLDAAYYGRDTNESTDLEVSDEEYDALARREAELCTAYPHLLALLEHETGLGEKTTRFGGRVGQLYADDNEQDVKPVKKTKKKAARSPAKKRLKRPHLTNAPMQSLDNAMDEGEAVAWLNRVRRLLLSAKQHQSGDASGSIEFPIKIFAEPKIDGLSLSLRYELQELTDNQCTYKFIWAATRGDGSQGEDVTDAVKAAWMSTDIASETKQYTVPKTITVSSDGPNKLQYPPAIIEIRGEVVLPQLSFEEFSEEIAKNPNATSFSNARNAASGILLRSKEPTSDAELERTRWLQSRLRFYAYDIAVSDTDGETSTIQIAGADMNEMRIVLANYGFDVPSPIIAETLSLSPAQEFNSSDIPKLLDYHRSVMTSRDVVPASTESSTKPPYHIDGVVYKLSDFKDRRICGSSSRTPRWAIAHKFPPLSAVTRLLDIDIQVGRTGALTPVAILQPVDLGGVMVSRASLHNFHFAKKVLLPGDDPGADSTNVMSGISILVSRAGDVIPQVMKRLFDDDIEDTKNDYEVKQINLEPPSHCPACGSPTTFEFISSPKQPRMRKKKKHDDDNMEMQSDDDQLLQDETGQVLRCSGPQLSCQPRAVNAMAYAFSRTALDVKGISKAKLQQLIEQDIIRYPADLFILFGGDASKENAGKREGEHYVLTLVCLRYSTLLTLVFTEMLEKIAALLGWGTLSSENLADSIQNVASKGVTLSRFIYSLGIPFIGTQASQLIATSYKTADAFLSALEDASSFDESKIADDMVHPFVILTGDDETDKVKGVGPVALSSLLAYSKEKTLLKAARDLAKALTIHEEATVEATENNIVDSPFKDMTIVFTGTLPISRTAAQNAAKERGARSTPNTVSKSTNIVVVGEKGGKKAKQAEEMGVQIMEVDEFMKLIKSQG